MTIRTILQHPHRELREVCGPVDRLWIRSGEMRRLADDMLETMRANDGLGLAAPQIGYSMRVFVLESSTLPNVYVNPEILEYEGAIVTWEGCLSVPGLEKKVGRAAKVTIKAQDVEGIEFTLVEEGPIAVAMQHEIDHLDGILMVDLPGVSRRVMR